jgi:integrase
METLYNVSKQEAEAILAKRIGSVRKGDELLDCDLTLSEIFDRFMKAKGNRLEQTSRDRYNSLMSMYLRPVLGHVKLASLRKRHIMEGLDAWMNREGRQPGGRTIRHAFDLLRNVLNWAVRHEYVAASPVAKISPEDLPKVRKPESAVLDVPELRDLLLEARTPTRRAKARGTLSSQPWFFPAVAFSAHTGARRGEVLAIRWEDFDLDQGMAIIRRSLAEPRSGLTFKEPRNGKARTINLDPEIVSILRAHRVAQIKERLLAGPGYKDGDLVFAQPGGGPVKPWNFTPAFKDLVARAQVSVVTLHDLRDTHASLLAKAGVPIDVVSRRLGHSSIGITVDRYLTVYPSRDAEAARAFEGLLNAV